MNNLVSVVSRGAIIKVDKKEEFAINNRQKLLFHSIIHS